MSKRNNKKEEVRSEAEGVDAAAETTKVSGADGAATASSDDGATTRIDAGGKPDGAGHPGQTEQASADGGSETEQGSDEVDPAQQVAELQDELLRRQADYENFRKRMNRDKVFVQDAQHDLWGPREPVSTAPHPPPAGGVSPALPAPPSPASTVSAAPYQRPTWASLRRCRCWVGRRASAEEMRRWR